MYYSGMKGLIYRSDRERGEAALIGQNGDCHRGKKYLSWFRRRIRQNISSSSALRMPVYGGETTVIKPVMTGERSSYPNGSLGPILGRTKDANCRPNTSWVEGWLATTHLLSEVLFQGLSLQPARHH